MKTNSEQIWYSNNLKSTFLLPLSWLFRLVVFIRRVIYKLKSSNTGLEDVFIIIVGNITVGGAGKTPFVAYLAQQFKQNGNQVGIISRGYKRKSNGLIEVMSNSSANEVGDEAVLLKQIVDCPVAVATDRREAACYLHANYQLDVIISDDGLQHYKLPRDYEIIIVDGEREFGNNRLLPAGPLREPVSRLNNVDLVISNGANPSYEYQYWANLDGAISIASQEEKSLETFKGLRVHAVAGIGNPKRFFDMLEDIGINVIAHTFADHHEFQMEDLRFDDELPILMTEKDVIKCLDFKLQNIWYVPLKIDLNAELSHKVNTILEEKQK
ncbi:MAG: tetraacyldisaccharide 4'-kinase [Pseudomonadota bacterium]